MRASRPTSMPLRRRPWLDRAQWPTPFLANSLSRAGSALAGLMTASGSHGETRTGSHATSDSRRPLSAQRPRGPA